MTNLVERLRRILERCGREWFYFPIIEEAATALEAQAKELAASRGELTDTQQALTSVNSDWNKAIARAETAEQRVKELEQENATAKKWQQWAEDERAKFERERDEARAALKPFADLVPSAFDHSYPDDAEIILVCNGEPHAYMRNSDFRAARAITGED